VGKGVDAADEPALPARRQQITKRPGRPRLDHNGRIRAQVRHREKTKRRGELAAWAAKTNQTPITVVPTTSAQWRTPILGSPRRQGKRGPHDHPLDRTRPD